MKFILDAIKLVAQHGWRLLPMVSVCVDSQLHFLNSFSAMK